MGEAVTIRQSGKGFYSRLRETQSGRQAGNAASVSPSEGNLRRLQSREGSWLKLFSLKQHQNNLLTQRVKRTGAKRSNFFYNMSFSVSGSSAANSFSLDWETKADSQCSTLFPSFQHLWPSWKRSESPGDQKKGAVQTWTAPCSSENFSSDQWIARPIRLQRTSSGPSQDQ